MEYMRYHPLRDELTRKDLKRIDKVIKNKRPEKDATTDEIVAAHDMYYDHIAAQMQTHYSVTTLQ
jgi:hypothetical protein